MSRLTEADIRQAMVLGHASGFLLTSVQISKLPNWPNMGSVVREMAQNVKCSIAFLKDVTSHNARFDDKWFVVFWPNYTSAEILASLPPGAIDAKTVDVFLRQKPQNLQSGYVLVNSRPRLYDEESLAWPQAQIDHRAKLAPVNLGLFWLLVSRQVWQRPPTNRVFVFAGDDERVWLFTDSEQAQLKVAPKPELEKRCELLTLMYQELQD